MQNKIAPFVLNFYCLEQPMLPFFHLTHTAVTAEPFITLNPRIVILQGTDRFPQAPEDHNRSPC
jgi:hypothetical protein